MFSSRVFLACCTLLGLVAACSSSPTSSAIPTGESPPSSREPAEGGEPAPASEHSDVLVWREGRWASVFGPIPGRVTAAANTLGFDGQFYVAVGTDMFVWKDDTKRWASVLAPAPGTINAASAAKSLELFIAVGDEIHQWVEASTDGRTRYWRKAAPERAPGPITGLSHSQTAGTYFIARADRLYTWRRVDQRWEPIFDPAPGPIVAHVHPYYGSGVFEHAIVTGNEVYAWPQSTSQGTTWYRALAPANGTIVAATMSSVVQSEIFVVVASSP
jgi:hypothetical protein